MTGPKEPELAFGFVNPGFIKVLNSWNACDLMPFDTVCFFEFSFCFAFRWRARLEQTVVRPLGTPMWRSIEGNPSSVRQANHQKIVPSYILMESPVSREGV